MPVTASTAHTAVRAANVAGKQVTVTYPDGNQITGTARWSVPGDPDCRQLMLFGVTNVAGPYTVVANGSRIKGPDSTATNPYTGTPYTTANTFVPRTGVFAGEVFPPYSGTVLVNLADITAVDLTAANSPLLLPATNSTTAQSNAADLTLGTLAGAVTGRVPDPGWRYGTGTE